MPAPKEDKKYTLKDLQNKLTEKERIFCHEYIIDWNGARAARVAGYEENRDRQTAYDMVTKSYIQQYIDFIKTDYEKECGITKIRQLKELTKIAYSSIAELHNKWIELKDFESLTNEQKNCIESIETKTEVKYKYDSEKEERIPVNIEYVKIKLYNKLSALDQINKMLGYNEAEKHEIQTTPIKGITFKDVPEKK